MAYKGGHSKGKNRYYNEAGFKPDQKLSDILTKLWDMDENKCFPDVDFKVDLQRYVKNTRQCVDDYMDSKRPLFSNFNEDVLERPTYKAFIALLDNYELAGGEAEILTWEEKNENRRFINEIMETPLMKECHKYLIKNANAPSDVNQFKCMLYNLWFMFIRRTKGDRDMDSSSFEHVFVGESRNNEFIGLHNWIQIYLLEKEGKLDYHGYFSWQTITKDTKFPRELALQFTFKDDDGGEKEKPMCSTFLGTSPEFEIAVYTICFFTKQGITDVQLGEYEVEIATMPLGSRHIGTAYIKAARM